MSTQSERMTNQIKTLVENVPEHLSDEVQEMIDEALGDGKLSPSEIYNIAIEIGMKAFSNLSMAEIFQVMTLAAKGQFNAAAVALLQGILDKD